MGIYLSKPSLDKESKNMDSRNFICGVSTMQGWRQSQEDSYNVEIGFDKDTNLFSVYDGHGEENVKEMLEKVFLDYDDHLKSIEVMEILKKLSEESKVKKSVTDEAMSLCPNEIIESIKNQCQEVLDNNLVSNGNAIKNGKPLAGPVDKLKSQDLVMSPSIKSKDKKCVSTETLITTNGCLQKESNDLEVKHKVDACGEEGAALNNEKNIENSPIKDSEPSSEVTKRKHEDKDNSENSGNKRKVKSCSELDKSENKSQSNSFDSSNNNEPGCSNDLSDSCLDISITEVSKLTDEACAPLESLVPTGYSVSPYIVKSEELSYLTKSEQDDNTNEKVEEQDQDDSEDLDINESGQSSNEDDESKDDEDDEENDDFDSSNEEDDTETEEDGSLIEKLNGDENNDEDFHSSRIKKIIELYENSGKSNLPGMDSGCTAVVSLLKKDTLYVANVGDSRCILGTTSNGFIEMSFDHKPEDEVESKRIHAANGSISCDGRINDGLNLSRCFGDFSYKLNPSLPNTQQMISAQPDIISKHIDDSHTFMFLASDGIWNCYTNQEVTDFINNRLETYSTNPSKICEELFDNCVAEDSSGDGTGCDNMTAILILFKKTTEANNK